jgi:two-component system chemotaxis response regulator CheB
MSLGAADCIAKPTSTGEINGAGTFKRDLVAKVKTWGEHARHRRARAGRPDGLPSQHILASLHGSGEIVLREPPRGFRAECLAIGSSTGGPQALVKVLACWANANMPVS